MDNFKNNRADSEKDISSSKERDNFKSKWGFVLACIGSAVGIGSIWLFPYRVGQYGGAAFLILYFVFLFGIGYVGVVGEMTLGRAMGTGPIGAFYKATKMRNSSIGRVIGWIPVIGSLGVAIGYSVVIGWIIKFLMGSISGSLFESDSGEYFASVSGDFSNMGWHLLGLMVTFVIMYMGIAKGIEKLNIVMVPAFYILFFILAVRVFTLPNSIEGYKYLFIPNWSSYSNLSTWIYALGMAFFSLSLAGSGTVVYGSYLKKSEDIPNCAKSITIFASLASVLCAIVIIPAVFAFNLDPTSGPPLMFITMPNIFKSIPFGRLFAVVFFLAVLFAAVTSLVNLFETPIEALQSRLNFKRKYAVLTVALISSCVSIFIENGNSVGVWMDVVSEYAIPLGALLAAIMLYWVAGTKFARENAQIGRDRLVGKWFEPMGKYVFVGCTFLIYVLGILLV